MAGLAIGTLDDPRAGARLASRTAAELANEPGMSTAALEKAERRRHGHTTDDVRQADEPMAGPTTQEG